MKNSGLIAHKTVLGYTIPKVAKNKITFGGKFNDRSTKAYKKYSLKRYVIKKGLDKSLYSLYIFVW